VNFRYIFSKALFFSNVFKFIFIVVYTSGPSKLVMNGQYSLNIC